MPTYEGQATMYMRMPMSNSNLPIAGTCTVEDKRVALKFPFTGIEFDLPQSPKENRNDFDFKIRGARGDMTLTIGYISELKCFTGKGVQEEDDTPVLTFTFWPSDSAMKKLPTC
ncbi:DgyrCDS5747 [Dimorphilus gyrociliatus]|uniref:DgyrCDS5747 n=1 Tax=Dimorphilus gyrociliatus TaxID=2664684 RepID=A0A7I8VQM8_9ANNE|nr:DgyrCDS5747 [Dimorphilus gyrociliatus]